MSLNSYSHKHRPPVGILDLSKDFDWTNSIKSFYPPTTTTTTNFYSGGPTIYWRPAGRRFKISSGGGLARGAGAPGGGRSYSFKSIWSTRPPFLEAFGAEGRTYCEAEGLWGGKAAEQHALWGERAAGVNRLRGVCVLRGTP